MRELGLETPWAVLVSQQPAPGTKLTDEEFKLGLKTVATLESIQDGKTFIDALEDPLKTQPGTNTYVFRQGLAPLWSEFPDGGIWQIRAPRKDNRIDVRAAWAKLLFAVLGEQLPSASNVAGVALGVRAGHCAISVWLVAAPEADFVLMSALRDALALPEGTSLEFSLNKIANQAGSSHEQAKRYSIKKLK